MIEFGCFWLVVVLIDQVFKFIWFEMLINWNLFVVEVWLSCMVNNDDFFFGVEFCFVDI